MEYIKMFLLVDGRSGPGISSIYATPFPTRTAELNNSYLTRLLSSVPRFGGNREDALLQMCNLASQKACPFYPTHAWLASH